MIGNDVTVTVLGVKGNQVRVGVNAPRDVAVHREEIFERIKREEQDGSGDRDVWRATTATPQRRRTPANGHATEQRLAVVAHGETGRLPDGADVTRPAAESSPGHFPAPSFTGRLRTFILRGSPKNGEMAEWSKARPC